MVALGSTQNVSRAQQLEKMDPKMCCIWNKRKGEP